MLFGVSQVKLELPLHREENFWVALATCPARVISLVTFSEALIANGKQHLIFPLVSQHLQVLCWCLLHENSNPISSS